MDEMSYNLGMSDLMISHGYVTHDANESWKCEDCKKIKAEFEAFTKTKEYAEILKQIEQGVA